MDEDLQNERKTRKRIAEIYTKEESDFASRAEYDDYLEETEDIILELLSGENVEDIEARIAKYKLENRESILRHRRRKLDETGASVGASLSILNVEPVADSKAGKGLRGPQPTPVQSGHELTADGCLQVKHRPKTATEWHVAAYAAGWSRSHYSEFTRTHVLDDLCRHG